MKILVCVYAATHNDVAVDAAGRIANATGGEVTAMFVKPEPPERYKAWMDIPSGHKGKSIRELYQELEGVTDTIFKRVDDILGKYNVVPKKITTKGKITQEILSHVDENEYDLVVVGTTGLKGIHRSMVGSVSYQVAENAHVPVLVVKKDGNFEKMLICTDGSEDAERAEHFGGLLASKMGMSVDLLSVSPEGLPKDEAEQCCARGQEILKLEGVEANLIIKTGKVRPAILDEAPNYDIVAIGSRGLGTAKRIIMGHVSLNVVEHGESNILVVRECPICGDK